MLKLLFHPLSFLVCRLPRMFQITSLTLESTVKVRKYLKSVLHELLFNVVIKVFHILYVMTAYGV